MRKTLIIATLAIAGAGVCIWATLTAQKFEDADGTVLRRATRLALHPTRRMVRHRDLLGVVQIPRLGLSVPFIEGADDKPLEMGAGHIPHTAFPGHRGNAGIAAHRDTCFRALRFIRPNDDIVVITPEGAYAYQVSATEIVTPQDGHVLHRTPNRTLTLVTCYPFFYVGSAPQRFIVHAEEPRSQLAAFALPPADSF